jgi:hypothetical protein
MMDRLSLSVIVTTIEPWPDLGHILDALQPQVAAFGGEIIVAASDLAAPEERVVVDTPRMRWLRQRDATIPWLRAMAVEISRGEVIATIEDDCIVADNWCAEIFGGFARHPLARAITGLTRDAERAPFDTAPEPRAPTRWLSVQARPSASLPLFLNANIAYQRSVFPPTTIPTGWIERDLNPRLVREGGVVFHEEMVVDRRNRRGLPGRAGRLPTGLTLFEEYD